MNSEHTCGSGLRVMCRPVNSCFFDMTYTLNSLKGVIQGIIQGTTIGVIKGDTRSLDNSSYSLPGPQNWGKNR